MTHQKQLKIKCVVNDHITSMIIIMVIIRLQHVVEMSTAAKLLSPYCNFCCLRRVITPLSVVINYIICTFMLSQRLSVGIWRMQVFVTCFEFSLFIINYSHIFRRQRFPRQALGMFEMFGRIGPSISAGPLFCKLQRDSRFDLSLNWPPFCRSLQCWPNNLCSAGTGSPIG